MYIVVGLFSTFFYQYTFSSFHNTEIKLSKLTCLAIFTTHFTEKNFAY